MIANKTRSTAEGEWRVQTEGEIKPQQQKLNEWWGQNYKLHKEKPYKEGS